MPRIQKKFSPLTSDEDFVKEIDRISRSLAEDILSLRAYIYKLESRIEQLEKEKES